MPVRNFLIALSILLCPVPSAWAQARVDIGIHFTAFPDLVLVPGYPVYYAPRASANYFFYDGLYWVYQGDNWYQSSWYNGPWQSVGPEYVPLYVLRVPVRYYRAPPAYFRGWKRDAPPRWGEHWGREWQTRHAGWDQWDRRAQPYKAAPLPVYQRQYSESAYPTAAEQQTAIRTRNYSYQPREALTQHHYRDPAQSSVPRPQEKGRDNRNEEHGPERR